MLLSGCWPGLAINPRRTRSAAVEAAEREMAEDEQQIRDLHDMWRNKEITTEEYRKDRREIRARIRENERKTIVKARSVESVADLIGPDAKASWDGLTGERKNSVLRFLFSAVMIGAPGHDTVPGTMDYGRIEIEQNELG